MSRIAATDRMSRLIAAIPWIADQDGVTLDEIAARFDYPRALLLEDLREVVFFVGVPPYTPDTLIEVDIDGDEVWIRYAEWFSRPMRLSGTEILALLAAGEASLAFDTGQDAGALARGLAKLRLSTGSTPETVDIGLGTVATPMLASIRLASERQQCLDISYHSFSGNSRTERRIEPTRVFLEAGHWYTSAYCHRAGADRVFRVDRIAEVEETGEPFTKAQTSTAEPQSGFELGDGPEITIAAPIDRAFLFERAPVRSIETTDDEVVVTLAASGQRWVEQLFLRLGPHARVVAGTMPVNIGEAARRVRGRYDL